MDRIGWHTVTRRLLIVALTLGAALMLIACGGDNSDAAEPAIASPIPHEAQVIAVVDEIFPEARPDVYGYCSVIHDASCPMTERLQKRLLDETMPICRCQNASSTREIQVETHEGGAVAHVTMYEGRVTYDLIMVMNDDNELVVDDQTCNGDAATSIYNSPVRTC